MEPDGTPSDSPTRFIGSQLRGGFDPLFDLLIHGLQYLAGTQHDLSTSAACERDAKALGKQVGNFTVRQAGAFVEINDSGLGVGAELALGGAGGVGRLPGLHRMVRV